MNLSLQQVFFEWAIDEDLGKGIDEIRCRVLLCNKVPFLGVMSGERACRISDKLNLVLMEEDVQSEELLL